MRARGPDGRYIRIPEPRPSALTAAVMTVPVSTLDRNPPRMAEAWQDRAWRLWRTIGVLNYPTAFKAKQVSRVRWDVTVDGTPLNPDQSDRILRAVTTPMGPAEATRRLALNLEVAGEAWYVRRAEMWEVVSTSATKFRDKLKDADIAVHGWIADPVDPEKPDSPVRAALDVAEEIRVLQALSRSQSRNRIAQRGILLRPSEGEFPDGMDFQATLERAMTAPIGDEYSASAVVPPVIAFKGDLIEKWKHLILESPYDEKLDIRLESAIRRLALTLDMPAEILLGLATVNHWTGWLAEEQMFRAHVERLAVLVGTIYAEAIREAAALTGVTGSIEVLPDASELLARRQSVADAFRALELGVVGFKYVLRQIGADDDDAPTQDELKLILALLGRTDPGGVPALGTGQTVTGPPPRPQEPSSNGNGTVTAAADVDDLETLGRRLGDIDIRLLAALEGATAMSVDRIRERHAQEPDAVGVQAAVAAETVRLGGWWRRELASARRSLRELGIDARGPAWDDAADHSRLLLEEGVSEYVTETLERSDAEMPTLPVPLLRAVLAAAGGSGTAVVAAIVRNPAPTFQDPQGFAIGVLGLKDLRGQDVELVQWRFRYHPQTIRTHPFVEHRHNDGRFMTADGLTSDGFYPGDHKGCLCVSDPVFRRSSQPQPVDEEVDA